MKIEENIKIKKLLINLFENQEFETSFEDDVTSWIGNDEEELYEEYTFKYYMEVGKVLGEGTKTVASINIIITEFTVDGEDRMLVWKEDNYDEHVWYIVTLENEIYVNSFGAAQICDHETNNYAILFLSFNFRSVEGSICQL
jgi:hypothetical protein